MIKTPIYLDYNATTPCDPRVVEAMLPYFTEHFGNAASRDHAFGWLADEAVELARTQIAELIGAKAKQITFTSGATESLNLAIKGLAEAQQAKGNHLIVTPIEHKAVLDTCAYLETKGFKIHYLGVDRQGQVDLNELEDAIQEQTIGIVAMYANNEIGTINPVEAIGVIAHRRGIPFICDATQAVGKIAINVEPIDMLAFSSHKIYGPKGVGALYVKSENAIGQIVPQQHGGKHERGRRSGTLNVPGIVGFGKAAELCSLEMEEENKRLSLLRDQLEAHLLTIFPGSFVNGGGTRLHHLTNLYFPMVESESLLLALSKELAISRGSACTGNIQQPSHVLQAIGLTDEKARNALRISLGRFTTAEELGYAVQVLENKIKYFQDRMQFC